MDAKIAAEIMAALSGAAGVPLFDYYGRELLPEDVVKGEPWALVGFPVELTGVLLTVAGQTDDGMLLVAPSDDQAQRFRVWPETVALIERSGAAVPTNSDAWWASVLATQTPGTTLSAFTSRLPLTVQPVGYKPEGGNDACS
jgi:hypothetical protein